MNNLNIKEAVNAEVNETLALLSSEYHLDKTLRKNIVLSIGITGTGKSTICQFMAGNPKLIAKRDGPTSDIYITDGNEKVSDSTTESKTLLPEVVLIPNTDTTLADCPGFGDTRSAKHDIAAAVYIKRLMNEAEQVKIMVTTSYHSVRKGLVRDGFTDLLDHVVNFIKDIDKYKDSIGLLVTKVDNKTVEDENGDPQYVPDNVIIAEIGSFLNTIKNELVEKNCGSVTIQLIDIFTEKNENNEYSKIGIFRRPTKIGDLYSNIRLSKNKKDIFSIINNGLLFSPTTLNEFGLSLSANTKNFWFKIRRAINNTLSDILNEYFCVYSQKLDQSKTDNIDSIKAAISHSGFIVAFFESENSDTVSESAITEFMEHFQEFDPHHPAQQYEAWKKQENLMLDLKSIYSTEDDDTNDSTQFKMQFGAFKDKLTANVEKMERTAENIIDQGIGDVISEVITMIKNKTVNLAESSAQPSCLKLSKQFEDISKVWQKFKTNNLRNPKLSFKEFLNNFKLNFTISQDHVQKLTSFETVIEFFKNAVNSTFTDGHQAKWLQGFNATLDDINSAGEWCSFIVDSYKSIIVSDIKNRKNLKNWKEFKKLSKELRTDETSNRILESRTELSIKEQMDLNNLVDSLQPSLSLYEHTFASTKLMIKDNIVKLSIVKSEFLPKYSSFTELYIFATAAVLIDASLIEPGKNVYIIAPLWKIEGPQIINLRGLDATSKEQTIISEAGHPGHPGGNFVGFGGEIVNGKDLTIDVSGGNGSNGKDGVDGVPGENGKTPDKLETTTYHVTASCANNLKQTVEEEIQLIESSPVNKYKLFGTKGTNGTKGGDGGSPGLGGRPGNIIIHSNRSIKVKQYKNTGNTGNKGKGGKGGTGGEHGKHQYVTCHCVEYITIMFYGHNFKFHAYESQGRAQNGADGVPGIAGHVIEPAQPQPFVPISEVLDQYKEYIQDTDLPYPIDSLKTINCFDPDC